MPSLVSAYKRFQNLGLRLSTRRYPMKKRSIFDDMYTGALGWDPAALFEGDDSAAIGR